MEGRHETAGGEQNQDEGPTSIGAEVRRESQKKVLGERGAIERGGGTRGIGSKKRNGG